MNGSGWVGGWVGGRGCLLVADKFVEVGEVEEEPFAHVGGWVFLQEGFEC